jgi:HSP20 family protein
MAKGKRSFFERLTGTVNLDDYDDHFEDERNPAEKNASAKQDERNGWIEEESAEGQLTVDVYQTPDEIIVKALVAGVRPEELDVSITRDMITIKGKRENIREVEEENYFYKELYWGSFSRTILLPQEIDVDAAEASEKHGLLTLRLPKIDKARQTKLKIKGS